MAKKQSGWNLATNLGSSPGSQGTLFSGGRDQLSDARWHRGYGPERQTQVRDAVVMQTRRPGDDGPFPHMSAKIPEAAYKARVVDTVARSTVPTHHLNGVQWLHTHPGEHLTQGDSAAGIYMKPVPGYRDHGLIAVKPEYTQDFHSNTVIHEIGHHVSQRQKNPWRALPGGHSRGTEEAFADNYMDTHFRDRRGNPATTNRIYGGGEYAGHVQRTPEFWQGYRGKRDHSLSNADVERQNEQYYKKYPEEKVHPDGSVDVPLVHKDYQADYEVGPPHTYINTDALPGTRVWN